MRSPGLKGSVRQTPAFSPFDLWVADPKIQSLFLLLLAGLMFFMKLGEGGLANYDHCFYAQKAKEILQSGSWLTMHHAGNPAFENPPMYMWLVALAYKCFGVNEYAAQFPSALLAVGAVGLTARLARDQFGSWAGLYAGFVLVTTTVFAKYARRGMVDITLTFFGLVAFMAFRKALQRNPKYFLLFGAASGAGILTKSVLGFFPPLIAVLFLLFTRRFKVLFSGWFLAGMGMALALGGVWYWHETMRFGSAFLSAHFGWLIFQRGFQDNPESWWKHLSYLRDLAIFYWPWLPVAAYGGYRLARQAPKDSGAFLFLLWPLVIISVMSVMRTRVFWYVLPAFPFLAIWAGVALDRWVSPAKRIPTAKIVMGFSMVLLVCLQIFPIRFSMEREQDVRAMAPYVKALAGSKEVRVLAYRQAYYGLNNALLFYSDHAADPIFQKPEELAAAWKADSLVLCVTDASELPALRKEIPNLHLVKTTSRRCLFANRPLDVSSVGSP